MAIVGNRVLPAVYHVVRTNAPDFLPHFTVHVLPITRVGCWQQHSSAVMLTNERLWPSK